MKAPDRDGFVVHMDFPCQVVFIERPKGWRLWWLRIRTAPLDFWWWLKDLGWRWYDEEYPEEDE